MQLRFTVQPGRTVRNPDTGERLVVGEIYEFPDSTHWRRRLQSKDIALASEKKAPAKSEAAPTAAAAEDDQEKKADAVSESDDAAGEKKTKAQPGKNKK